ncbi:MAG: glycosyltransferase family 4 protein, partial [Thermoproteota archaeon]|nr:glycosyltransferase family 4 protein [Thermoproteota archaeon]
MRILFLTAHLPFPPFSGGRRREFELISRLGKDFEIHLCSITKTWETDIMYISNLLYCCASVNLFKAVFNDNKQYAIYPNQIKRHTSEEASSYISFLLKNKPFDVVHVEGYYLMQHLPIKPDIPVLLVEHNIECLLNLQRFKLATIQQDKSYYWQEYVYTLKWERTFWKRATKCVTLTTEDESNMRQLEPHIDIRTIPNGIDHRKMIDEAPSSNICKNSIVSAKCPSILFVGNFLYEPNIDAALYFSQLIFPLILKDVPNAKLHLVGNAPPPEVSSLTLNKQIKVSGYVDSLTNFYKDADVVVCPLRIGGGVKVKVLEALNAGKAIVSTSIGAQGLNLSTYPSLTVSDEVADFAEKVVRFLLDPQKRYRQEQQALAYASILPTWDQ